MQWNLADIWEAIVDMFPDRDSVITPNRFSGRQVLTFAEVDERATRLAHTLMDSGVQPGDHVGVYAYNSTEYVEAQWAAWKIRAVPVNVNFRYVEGELAYLFDNADLVALIHGREFIPRIANVLPSCPKLKTCIAIEDGTDEPLDAIGALSYDEALKMGSAERDFAPRSSEDRYIIYTGGTTGMPKGVMWTHEDFFKATIAPLIFGHGHTPSSPEEVIERSAKTAGTIIMLPVAPLMHGAAQWVSMFIQLSGNALCLSASRRMNPDEIWDIVEAERVMSITIVGDAQARPLLDALATRERDLTCLFVIGSGGALLSPAVKEAFAKALPHIMVLDSLGASETGYQGPLSGMDQHGRPQFTFGDHTIVLGDDGHPTTPGDGVVGHLARRGHIPIGYYKDEVKTAETFPTIHGSRWVVAGDMAIAEADGTITLLGRGSVSINSGGEKIFPEEVESALKSHPGVFDVVVVGAPDERWGERVTAVLVPQGDTPPTLESLADHCRSVIAAYKVPRDVVFVDEMVRSPSGKADYRWAKATAIAAIEARA
ncbi:MAG: acyl-CoA synthetase [Acidimicrobiia bacterium]